jgi:hypothetical protein
MQGQKVIDGSHIEHILYIKRRMLWLASFALRYTTTECNNLWRSAALFLFLLIHRRTKSIMYQSHSRRFRKSPCHETLFLIELHTPLMVYARQYWTFPI